MKAGLDIELPNPVEYPQGLKDALDKRLISEIDIDRSVSRVLKLKFRLGQFENPYFDIGSIDLDLPKGKRLAKTIAEKSIALLTNDGVLPLSKSVGKMALIDPHCR